MAKGNQQKTDPKIISGLQSQNPEQVIETIDRLRSSGNLSYLPVLFGLLASSVPEVNAKVMGLLADVKHRDIIPLLLEAIQDERYKGERKKLVSLCWENGLDFSSGLPVFVDLLINEGLEVAFEAYTVITNMEGKITAEMMNTETDRIEAALSRVDEQKRQLLTDIIDFLPELSN